MCIPHFFNKNTKLSHSSPNFAHIGEIQNMKDGTQQSFFFLDLKIVFHNI